MKRVRWLRHHFSPLAICAVQLEVANPPSSSQPLLLLAQHPQPEIRNTSKSRNHIFHAQALVKSKATEMPGGRSQELHPASSSRSRTRTSSPCHSNHELGIVGASLSLVDRMEAACLVLFQQNLNFLQVLLCLCNATRTSSYKASAVCRNP